MERRVTQSGKDKNGDITGLCSPGAAWSPRAKTDAINDIERGLHRYYVDAAGYATDVNVVTLPSGTKYLRTTADKTHKNNLDNLPDC